MPSAGAALATLRVLVLALEFTDPIFSGNGVLGRSLVSSMADEILAHHAEHVHRPPVDLHGPHAIPVAVDVICARPVDDYAGPGTGGGVGHVVHDEILGHGVRVVTVPVPSAKWKRLDRRGPWREFGEQVEAYRDDLFAAIGGTTHLNGYSSVLAVDYTGAIALHKLIPDHERTQLQQHHRLHFLNFRVFAASADPTPREERERAPHPHTFGQWWAAAVADDDHAIADPEHPPQMTDWLFYATIEAIAGTHSSSNFALCRADIDDLLANTEAVGLGHPRREHWHVLLPPIRRDMAALAREHQPSLDNTAQRVSASAGQAASRLLREVAPASAAVVDRIGDDGWDDVALVTCVVRLDPAKEALRFVNVTRALLAAQRDLLTTDGGAQDETRRRRLVAFVAGAAGDRAYAADVITQLRATGIEVIVAETFLNASAMATVWRAAALNVHPPAYEAYGMTIVEAAAFGVPTLVHHAVATVGADAAAALRTRVGAASELLRAHQGHVIPVDYTAWAAGPATPSTLATAADVASMLLRRPVRDDAPVLVRSATGARAAMARQALSYTEADLARTVLVHIEQNSTPPHVTHGGAPHPAERPREMEDEL